MIKSKLSKSCTIMYRASFVIDKCGMLILYHSLFLPYIMYCIEVWGNTYATNLNCLVLLQKKVVRLICRAKRLDHTSCLFSKLRILKVPDIVEIRTALIMYKANNILLPVNIQKLFTLYKSVYVTRQSPTFKQNYAHTNLKRMCISVKGVILWNSLNSSLVCCRNVHRLKEYTANILVSYVVQI